MIDHQLFYRFLTCVTWLYRKIELVLSLLGIIFCNLPPENLDFVFLKTLCIFRSVAAVGSLVSRLKCPVFNNAIHFSVYLVLCSISTPLPLSYFKITMSLFLDRLSMTFLYLHETLILLYFSQILLSLVYNDVNSLSGIYVEILNKPW